jgi:subtilisin family serine protease
MSHAVPSHAVRRLAPATAALLLAAACADPGRMPTAPAASAAPEAAKGQARPAGQPIPGQYIVVFRDDVDDVDGKIKDKVKKANARLKHAYKSAVKGFAGELSDAAVAELRADPDVAYVEQDQLVTVDATQSNATWGIDRIDQRNLPRSGTYTYTSTGAGVARTSSTPGILTGPRRVRQPREQRVRRLRRQRQDCNGHGRTSPARWAGSTYGVAKGRAPARRARVPVLGSSSNSTIIAGIDWVTGQPHQAGVANLSLGGGYSRPPTTRSRSSPTRACSSPSAPATRTRTRATCSPASAPGVTTVAASTSADAKRRTRTSARASTCTRPARRSRARGTRARRATNTISGTSMATPHVAGVAALYKAASGRGSQGDDRHWLKNNATAERDHGAT